MREVLAGHRVACHLRDVLTTASSEAAGGSRAAEERGLPARSRQGSKSPASLTSQKPVLGPDKEACLGPGLTTSGVLAQFLEERSQRVQFLAKAGPVAGFQLLHGLIVVAERLARSIGLGAGECAFG